MNRRHFLASSGLLGLGIHCGSLARGGSEQETSQNLLGSFSCTENQVAIYTHAQVKPTRIFHITDTHLSLDDERGVKYLEYSKRMANAYKSNRHFQTGEAFSAEESFEQTLDLAIKQEVDFLALTGDIFSFPSRAAVEWALEKLTDTGIPFAYVAGNHDWHYEGMAGSAHQLRDTWCSKHLKPMYQGNKPLYATYDLNGIRFVCIDNSTYEIEPEQLAFFKTHTRNDRPLILLMHIPLYMPGRSLGFGCANPNWGESSDRNFRIERREKWRAGGHTRVTLEFYDEVFNASNLLTVLAGHTHRHTLDIKNGVPQLVSAHNAAGYYLDVNIATLHV
ncbi:MAG: metallophosphoesterase [Phycisphaerae bacterium]|nr:metallophosphoesterase [Phycisphaerae bacterium]